MSLRISKDYLKSKSREILSYLIFLGLILVIGLQPIPYVRSQPGSTYDSYSQIDGVDLISISDSAEYPVEKPSGELHILTVNSWGGPNGPLVVGDAIRALWDRSITIEPVEFLYPDPVDSADQQAESEFQFSSSGNTAIAVALTYLGIPLDSYMQIYNVNQTADAANKLLPGDILRKLNDTEIPDFAALTEFMKTQEVGSKLLVTVERAGETESFTIKLGEDDEGNPRIGIYLYTKFFGPMDITVHLENVGGPSAGLAFTLAIYDKLSPGDLLKSKTVAVTGTINFDNTVGAIGGLYQKMAAAKRAGAKWMLIPSANCGDAVSAPTGLRIIPVDTFVQAVEVLEGKTDSLPKCPAS